MSLRSSAAACRALLEGSDSLSGQSIIVGLGLARTGLAPFQGISPCCTWARGALEAICHSALKFKCRKPQGSSLSYTADGIPRRVFFQYWPWLGWARLGLVACLSGLPDA